MRCLSSYASLLSSDVFCAIPPAQGVAVAHSRYSVRAGPQCMCPFCRLILASFPVWGQDEKILVWKFSCRSSGGLYESSHSSTFLLLHVLWISLWDEKNSISVYYESSKCYCRIWSTRDILRVSRWKSLECHHPGMLAATWCSSFWIFLLMHATF